MSFWNVSRPLAANWRIGIRAIEGCTASAGVNILLDECVPQPLRRFLADDSCRTAQEMGWKRRVANWPKNHRAIQTFTGTANAGKIYRMKFATVLDRDED